MVLEEVLEVFLFVLLFGYVVRVRGSVSMVCKLMRCFMLEFFCVIGFGNVGLFWLGVLLLIFVIFVY